MAYKDADGTRQFNTPANISDRQEIKDRARRQAIEDWNHREELHSNPARATGIAADEFIATPHFGFADAGLARQFFFFGYFDEWKEQQRAAS